MKNNETINEIKRILGFKIDNKETSNEMVVDDSYSTDGYGFFKIKVDNPSEFYPDFEKSNPQLVILFDGEDSSIQMIVEKCQDWDELRLIGDDRYANCIECIDIKYGIEHESEIPDILEAILNDIKSLNKVNLIQDFIQEMKELNLD